MNISTNAQQSALHFTIEVSKQEDGQFKASSQGLEFIDSDPIHATRELKKVLTQATLDGTLQGQNRRIA